MTTARQLLPAFVDAPPLSWDRRYVQNLRQIRGWPTYWRIIDSEAYVDGPPQEGEQYTRELFNWRVQIVKDDEGNNTDTLELFNLINTLEESSEVVAGETVYSYKYRTVEPELTYQHTNIIDSVSVEFDQLGRRLIAFESAGHIFLLWYDPVEAMNVVTDMGEGYTPHIVTDTYRRTGGAADSERFLFYIDNTTKQIVYRKQSDRYLDVYSLPSAPSDVVELLKVSKNIYGGLTILFCYEDTGELKTGSFTARAAEDVSHIGSDANIVDTVSLNAVDGSVTSFSIFFASKEAVPTDFVSLTPVSGAVTSFAIQDNIVRRSFEDSTSLSPVDGAVTSFNIKDVLVRRTAEDTLILQAVDGVVTSFNLQHALIPLEFTETISMAPVTGAVTSFEIS